MRPVDNGSLLISPWRRRRLPRPRTLLAAGSAAGLVLIPAPLSLAEGLPMPPLKATGSTAPPVRLASSQSDPPVTEATLRYGRHDGFDRLVFAWPAPVAATLERTESAFVIRFDRRIEADAPPPTAFSHRNDVLPQLVFGLMAEADQQGFGVFVDPDARVAMRRWEGGRLIVVDILQPAADEPATVVAAPADDRPADEPDLGPDPVEDDGDDPPDSPGDVAAADEEDEEEAGEIEPEEMFEVYFDVTQQFGIATAEDDLLSDEGETDNGYAFLTDTDIYFEIYGTFLDDIEVGATVGLEADAVDGEANADETYIYIGNGFGQFQIGRTTGAEDDMALGAGTIAPGTGGIDGDTSNLGETEVNTSGDAAKVSYFTPRIAGVQFGVSYTPDLGDEEEDNDDFADVENHLGLGLNWVETLGDGELSLGVVGSFGDSEFSSADDLSAFSIGGIWERGALGIGASYGQTAEDDDFDFATFGITFGFDEVSVGFGYNYVDEKDEDGIAHIFALGGDAPLLPGVELQGDVSYALPQEDDNSVASVLAVEMSY